MKPTVVLDGRTEATEAFEAGYEVARQVVQHRPAARGTGKIFKRRLRHPSWEGRRRAI